MEQPHTTFQHKTCPQLAIEIKNKIWTRKIMLREVMLSAYYDRSPDRMHKAIGQRKQPYLDKPDRTSYLSTQ